MLTSRKTESLPYFQGRLLILLCSYRGGVGNHPPFSFSRLMPKLGLIAKLMDQLTLLPLRSFIASNRDFFANIRPVDYQIDLLEHALALGKPSKVIIRIDEKLQDDITDKELILPKNVEICPADKLWQSDNKIIDNVIAIYPDALGLGWEPLERRLPKGKTYIINGRRRLFCFNYSMRRRLRWRRFYAETRLVELIASSTIIPVAAGLAFWDFLRGRN